jgi:hypothetical protein
VIEKMSADSRRQHWEDLARRQRGVYAVTAALPLLMVLLWAGSQLFGNFEWHLPNESLNYAVLGLLEIAAFSAAGVSAWKRFHDFPLDRRLWKACLAARPVLRLMTVLPFIYVLWLGTESLATAQFMSTWRGKLGISDNKFELYPFYILLWSPYVWRLTLLPSGNPVNDGNLRDRLTSMPRRAWGLPLAASGLIGINVALYKAGFATFWPWSALICCMLCLMQMDPKTTRQSD